MSKMRTLFSNTLALALLLMLAVSVVWFFSSRSSTEQPVAQEAKATSPLPTPVPTKDEPPSSEPKETPTPSAETPGPPQDDLPDPTDTPAPTRIIEVTPVVVTIIPTPTDAPTPTPTPTFEPLSDKPIGGYVFSPPELIEPHSFMEITGWKPESNDELVVTVDGDDVEGQVIAFFNIKSGQRERVAVAPNSILGRPVWLPETRQMSFIAYDKVEGKNNNGGELYEMQLFLTNPSGRSVSVPKVNGVSPPVVPALDRRSPVVFDKQMRQLERIDPGNGRAEVQLTLPDLPIIDGGPFGHYQAAWSDQTDWVAYHNPEKFILINTRTSEVQEMDLGAKIEKPGRFWPTYSVWSPDGQKLAMVVTSSPHGQNISFTQLAILDLKTGEVQLIEDDFSYISNLAWAPNSQHILIGPIIRTTTEGRVVNALFLVDIQTQEIIPVPIIPDGAAIIMGSFKALAWSPDGQFIVVGFTEDRVNASWYRVAVEVADEQ